MLGVAKKVSYIFFYKIKKNIYKFAQMNIINWRENNCIQKFQKELPSAQVNW